mmetsp:Transcript_38492/g.44348  ORF Transcript_38492/g.44348 Transcript_38492/m.44348 type:complete len:84 (+) Transcript_38492:472-723(+)
MLLWQNMIFITLIITNNSRHISIVGRQQQQRQQQCQHKKIPHQRQTTNDYCTYTILDHIQIQMRDSINEQKRIRKRRRKARYM